ncbi:MAG: phosphonate ABC transporter ATP-binding protein [Spirochaetia bacterium]|jgi:phosphonate transport system ATP-binding protein
MALLEITHLWKRYNDVTALTDVSLKVHAGEFVTVIGRSGAGKSTLLRCVNRLVEANAGTIEFDGVDVRSLKKQELRHLRTRIGMIFQHFNLVPRQTVIENVLHGLLGYKSTLAGVLGLYTAEEKEKAFDLLERVGLKDQVRKRCDQLSGGQKQRVGIARALIQEPHLILCDEPIASLDPGSAKKIMDRLHRISREMNITILMNLHQVDVAIKYSDRIIGVREGRVVYDDDSKKLKKKVVAEIYGSEAEDILFEEQAG